MKNADKRAEIMQSALKVIAEHGFHGAPIATIAEEAGVAAGTIYLYFESKDVLITELYNELERKLIATLQEGYSPERSIRDRFIHVGTTLLRYHIEHPLQFRYIQQYHNSPYGVSLRRERFLGKSTESNIFIDLLEQGIAQQVVKDLPLVAIIDLAFGPLFFLARDHILGFVVADQTLIEQVVTACWEGIRR
jgi:TetR/AcrR family transcriptional regulator, repressor of fatR-cypB operon